jgi:hypothetical protein
VPVRECFLYSKVIPASARNKKRNNLDACIEVFGLYLFLFQYIRNFTFQFKNEIEYLCLNSGSKMCVNETCQVFLYT